MTLIIPKGIVPALVVGWSATAIALSDTPMLDQWLPGAFAQVRVVERSENADRGIVEVTEVFTGSPDLVGERVVIDRTPAHRMPPDAMLWSETVVVVEVIDAGKPGGRGLGAPNPPSVPGRAVVTRVITGDAAAGDAFAVVPDWNERLSIGMHFLARVPRDEDALLLVTDPQFYSWNVNMPIDGPWNEDGPTKFKSRLEPEEMIDDWLPWLTKAAETPKSDALGFFREAVREAPLPVPLWAASQAMAVDPVEALAFIDAMAGDEAVTLRLLMLQDSMRRMPWIGWSSAGRARRVRVPGCAFSGVGDSHMIFRSPRRR